MQQKKYTYLALGDSYTIGEGLPMQDNFPYQTVQLLSESGYSVEIPTIVAKTGWTTDELQRAIGSHILQTRYDLVSLLIGVNNQYRDRDPEEYAKQFEELLQQAIQFAGNSSQVFVLSIPDWSVTPFAEGRDREFISNRIDLFNSINKMVSTKWKVNYIEVTTGSRESASDTSLIAGDGLHPSAKEYNRWARKLAAAIEQQIH